MPIYEYECRKCSRRFEHLSKGSTNLPCVCPHCGGKNIEKVLSSFSVGPARRPDSMPGACAFCPSAACPRREH